MYQFDWGWDRKTSEEGEGSLDVGDWGCSRGGETRSAGVAGSTEDMEA